MLGIDFSAGREVWGRASQWLPAAFRCSCRKANRIRAHKRLRVPIISPQYCRQYSEEGLVGPGVACKII